MSSWINYSTNRDHTSKGCVLDDLATFSAVSGSSWHIFSLKDTGDERPLFFLYFSGLKDIDFERLMGQMKSDAPVYAVVGEFALGSTIEGAAVRLAELIGLVQPNGPYRILADFYWGGLLAYELAHHLIGLDKSVEIVALVKTDEFDNGLVSVSDECLDDTATKKTRTCETEDWRSVHEKAMFEYVIHTGNFPIYLFQAKESLHAGSSSSGMLSEGHQFIIDNSEIIFIEVAGYRNLDAKSITHRVVTAILEMVKDERGYTGAVDTDKIEKKQLVISAIPELVYKPLFTIQPGRRTVSPVFCFPGAGDSVTKYLSLVEALGDDYPVHGLQPRGLDGVLAPHTSVDAIARMCFKAITNVNPLEPIHLVGHSFGGWVAFETALILSAKGVSISSITIIDSEVPSANNIRCFEYTSNDVLKSFVESIRLVVDDAKVDFDSLSEISFNEGLEYIHQQMVRFGLMPKRSSPNAIYGAVRCFGAALRTAYSPKDKYMGAIRLIQVDDVKLSHEENISKQREVAKGWKRYAPMLTEWCGPGNHMTILKKPHVYELAQWWRGGNSIS
jgi:thioesterase domain-containing protein